MRVPRVNIVLFFFNQSKVRVFFKGQMCVNTRKWVDLGRLGPHFGSSYLNVSCNISATTPPILYFDIRNERPDPWLEFAPPHDQIDWVDLMLSEIQARSLKKTHNILDIDWLKKQTISFDISTFIQKKALLTYLGLKIWNFHMAAPTSFLDFLDDPNRFFGWFAMDLALEFAKIESLGAKLRLFAVCARSTAGGDFKYGRFRVYSYYR